MRFETIGLFIFGLIFQLTYFSTAKAQELPFNYLNNKAIVLRSSDLSQPQVIDAGSTISIDPQYLQDNLGTATPTQEQVQRLLLNPGEASKGRIVTQEVRDFLTRQKINDYFFSVVVKDKSGIVKKGKMAFNSYFRTGKVELHRTDGEDPEKHQSAEITDRLRTFIDDNRNNTEARGDCKECRDARSSAPTQSLADIARALSDTQLWNRYQSFAREFNAANPNITRGRAGYYKRLFVKSLIEKFGIPDATRIMKALTGFAESPHRSSEKTQIAEIAAIIKVIENRGNRRNGYNSRTLRDIGIDLDSNRELTAILADWQFSAWNDSDNNLVRILKFNPDRSDDLTKRKMMLAFESQDMMGSDRVKFEGKMSDPSLTHYHANYVNPSWDRASSRVQNPTIVVDGERIDLSKQYGSRHIFYVGII